MKEKYDIFFSYSHKDGGIARQLVRDFEKAGLNCFLAEKDVAAGELWESRIRDAIMSSSRIVLLITPRSKASLWIAAEAGAGWALGKDLVAALMFVENDDLIDPIRRHQTRTIETEEQVNSLIAELCPDDLQASDKASMNGQWVDPSDDDVAFFIQTGNRVVGFYDYGSGKKAVGVYVGTFDDGVLDYGWHWLERNLSGRGRMRMTKLGKSVSGEWWYDDNKKDTDVVQYCRISGMMPSWLSEEDFDSYRPYLDGKGKPPKIS